MQKMLPSAKLRGSGYLKVHFLKLNICVYSRTKFQFSSIILGSFRQGLGVGNNFTPPTYPPPNKPFRSPHRLGLRSVSEIIRDNSFIRSIGIAMNCQNILSLLLSHYVYICRSSDRFTFQK